VSDTLSAKITLDKDFVISAVDPRLFGGFIEHIGRAVYTGIYEPGHPAADPDGLRADVYELVRELDMPVTRYPGGNFVSGYNWEDGVGPRAQRPRRLDLAWRAVETNQFGTNEFIRWCRKANTAPLLAVNLGTRGADAAAALVEYCNHPGGSAWSDLRRAHGHAAPHGVKLWCLGNEMDGPWQMGHRSAGLYGQAAASAAHMMKRVDPTIELVVCGSSHRKMRTFGAWELEVLEHTYDLVDYLSLHTYYGDHEHDLPGFLAKPDTMSDFIDETAALCDAVAARRHATRRMMLSFDEWNVWYHSNAQDERVTPWAVAPPLVEDVYTAADALVVGGMLITLLNHADRVKVACIAQTVNVIGPIMTRPGGPAWRQTIFYPFQQASRFGRGVVLRQLVESPTYDAKERAGVPYLKSACVWQPADQTLTVFALNRSLDQSLALAVDLRAFPTLALKEWVTLRYADLDACNTADQPNTVTPQTRTGATVTREGLSAVLGPASWNVIRLERPT